MIKKQWFVKMDELIKPAVEAVKKGEIKLIPERMNKIYYNWTGSSVFSGHPSVEKGQRAEENHVSSVSGSCVKWVSPHFGHTAGAPRLTLITGNAPGNDMRFYYERVEASRNFVADAAHRLLHQFDGVLLFCILPLLPENGPLRHHDGLFFRL